jgi:hypothetical protein
MLIEELHMRIMLGVLAMLVISSTKTPSVKAAGIHFTNRIESIAPEITDVYECGRWQQNNLDGYYRVVYVGFYNGNSLLYVQWVKDPDFSGSSHTPKILHTLSIAEFNTDDHSEMTFAKPQCKENNHGISFAINARKFDVGEYNIKIYIKHEFGKYTYDWGERK